MVDIPEYIFENKKIVDNIINEQKEYTLIQKITFDKGVYIFYEGGEYPQKVLSTPNIIASINIIKAIFVGILGIRPNAESILRAFNKIGMRILSEYFLKDEYRTLQTRELSNALYHFAFSLTSHELIASQFSKIVSHIVEYDNAYRLRFVDLASEIDSISLHDNPKKEIKRLLSLWTPREVQHKKNMTNKIEVITSKLLWILSIPSVKKAFVYATGKTNFDNMKYDNIDRYWACLRKDYNFMGLSYEDRMALIHNQGYSIPVLRTK